MLARRPWTLVLLLLAPLACTNRGDDNDDDNDGDNNPSAWLVGDQGTMVRFSASGEASGYALETSADLLAIACHGRETAWVVGAGGTVVRSRDAGASWDFVDLELELDRDLRALAVAEHTPEGVEAVWIVGEAGTIVHTPDGGQSWLTIPGAEVEFTGVATEPEGNSAIAVADDGSIWAIDEAAASQVHASGAPLWAVGMAGHAELAVAVGADGTMLRSTAGDGWSPVELPSTRDLHAVQVAGDGSLVVAVGEAGVVVRVASDEVSVVEQLDDGRALRGLHLRADGRGQMVGDDSLVLINDVGFWIKWTLGTDVTLRGVDDFHGDAHL